ncbi:short-chain fatty acid transporter [Nitriliruptor alkaliphilus]|uniref:short-chain fatty acid transporter n=1 Tax=Nitriliruptor alkaliphilus TaxID=427918 RepID=UPI0006960A7E|nr:TIGR00366 family protein [Nitriliruptor alkaliphilus]
MRAIAKPFITFVERYYPDPFVFAIGLTFVVFALTLGLTDAGPAESLSAWGAGLAGLLEFITQISIVLITGHALAHTDPMRRLLGRVASLPRSPNAAYGLVTLVAALASLVNWGFGLVVGALLARQVAMAGRERGLSLHYPLLVASAYAGFVVWHMGYSSSSALFVATPGHALEDRVGGVIPVTETIFAPWNIATAVVAVVAIVVLMPTLRPRGADATFEIPDAAIADYRETQARMDRELGDGQGDAGYGVGRGPGSGPARDRRGTGGPGTDTDVRTHEPEPDLTPAERLDRSRVVSLALGLALVVYLAYWFGTEGLNLTLDIVNWTFLALGLLLSRSALHYVKLVTNAARTVGQIILQYPLYAGIMGLMIDTGLVSIIADWFISISTAGTLSFFAFLSGGIVNFFIPSGGGQWAVQGPIFIEAAQTIGTDPSRVVMGVAYGDQWSNMIQPFWTIPLLAVAGLHMRRVLGYTFVVFLVTFVVFTGGLLLAGAG